MTDAALSTAPRTYGKWRRVQSLVAPSPGAQSGGPTPKRCSVSRLCGGPGRCSGWNQGRACPPGGRYILTRT